MEALRVAIQLMAVKPVRSRKTRKAEAMRAVV